MKRFVVLTAACIAISGGAMAQETFGELYEKGAINLTNSQVHLARLLRAHGVPDACLAQLNFRDATQIQDIIDDTGERNLSQGQKETEVGNILRQKCG